MKVGVYAVLDTVVAAYMPPFFARTDAEALRMFKAACSSGKSDLSDKTKDIALFSVGHFDDHAGVLVPLDAPVRLMTGIEAVQPE